MICVTLQKSNFLPNDLKKKLDYSSRIPYTRSMNDRNWGGFRKGSGRKTTGRNIVNITLTLTKTEAKNLRERAEQDGLSVSRFISKWLCLNTLPESLTDEKRLTDGII